MLNLFMEWRHSYPQGLLFIGCFCALMLGYFALSCAKTPARKLILSLALVVLSSLGLRFTQYGLCYPALIAGISLSVLYAFGLGRELTRADRQNRARVLLGMVFEIPFLILALISILLGCAFAWFACVSLTKMPRDYGMFFAGMGFGLMLIYMGVRWIRSIAMKRSPSENQLKCDELK
jgi:peptidoglycan biosynthesis protein MviN/MurJ (putative lipid II flippase)